MTTLFWLCSKVDLCGTRTDNWDAIRGAGTANLNYNGVAGAGGVGGRARGGSVHLRLASDSDRQNAENDSFYSLSRPKQRGVSEYSFSGFLSMSLSLTRHKLRCKFQFQVTQIATARGYG